MSLEVGSKVNVKLTGEIISVTRTGKYIVNVEDGTGEITLKLYDFEVEELEGLDEQTDKESLVGDVLELEIETQVNMGGSSLEREKELSVRGLEYLVRRKELLEELLSLG